VAKTAGLLEGLVALLDGWVWGIRLKPGRGICGSEKECNGTTKKSNLEYLAVRCEPFLASLHCTCLLSNFDAALVVSETSQKKRTLETERILASCSGPRHPSTFERDKICSIGMHSASSDAKTGMEFEAAGCADFE
jgi:hypothetical protein